MNALAGGDRRPLLDAMADDVTWRWMGVTSWSKVFEGKRAVVEDLFGGVDETLTDDYSVQVHHVHAGGDHVVVEHTGRNQTPDGRRYDNHYCWVLQFRDGKIVAVREYMDTQLVTETFDVDPS